MVAKISTTRLSFLSLEKRDGCQSIIRVEKLYIRNITPQMTVTQHHIQIFVQVPRISEGLKRVLAELVMGLTRSDSPLGIKKIEDPSERRVGANN